MPYTLFPPCTLSLVPHVTRIRDNILHSYKSRLRIARRYGKFLLLSYFFSQGIQVRNNSRVTAGSL